MAFVKRFIQCSMKKHVFWFSNHFLTFDLNIKLRRSEWTDRLCENFSCEGSSFQPSHRPRTLLAPTALLLFQSRCSYERIGYYLSKWNVWKCLELIPGSSDYQSIVIIQQQLLMGIIFLFLLKTGTKTKVKVFCINLQKSIGLILFWFSKTLERFGTSFQFISPGHFSHFLGISNVCHT